MPRTRAPKRPRTLPRPASPADAIALAEEAGAAAPNDWIGARDLAILLLLYGAGLRVAEAMGLTARVLPLGQAMRVTGKRGKTRIVPLVPAVREAINAYVALCPYPLAGEARLFVGAKGGPLNPDLVRRAVRGAQGAAGPARQPDAACACATASRRICWRAGRTCDRCRNCWATPACRRRRFTRKSTRRGCSTSIATPIRAPEQVRPRPEGEAVDIGHHRSP